MSFQNMYRQRDPKGRYSIATAIAMPTMLFVNIWSCVLLASLVDRGWLANRRRIGTVEFAALSVGLFVVEMILVNLIFAKVDEDKGFALYVGSASPRISMWYGGISVVILLACSALKIGLSF